MTAEVAVINTLGVAIAADSAVTIGNNKTYYTQQKIYNLSKKHSVGIMIYGDSEFMHIDWEIIINEFRKDMGDRVLDTLEEYAKKLLVFLRDCNHLGDSNQKSYLATMSYWFFDEIKNAYKEEVSENHNSQELTKAQQNKILAGVLKKAREKLEKTADYISFTDDGFVESNRAVITKEMEDVFSDLPVNDKTKEEMTDLFLMDIGKMEIGRWLNYNSGIVFAGYGDKEIFPSTVEYWLFGKLGKNILYDERDVSKIDLSNFTAGIHPYSQPNVINSFIRGMDPDFRNMIDEELDRLAGKIAEITGEKHAEKTGAVIKELKDKIQSFQDENFKNPVLSIVSSLPKSDLAEMAEALVNITALRQHVSTEQETVGGPTDVALITKTDGFIWIKKKQIFHSVHDNAG